MVKISPILVGLSLAVVGSSLAAAQDSTPRPNQVLQITREWVKPGKTGAVHDKSEAAFVAAMNKGKVAGHYIALNSMSGKARALYIAPYPSFEAWEKDNKTIEKNVAVSADLERAAVADGELLDGLDQAVYTYDEQLSYNPHADVSHARYFEINIFHVRPGHRKDWYEVTKKYKAANDKAGTGQHWAAYEVAYGGEAGTYITLSARDSLSEVDGMAAMGKKLTDALGGEEGMEKLDEMFWQALDSARTELFSVNPRQSYVDEAWIKADPDFWKPKAPTAAKPATAAASAKPAASATPKPASR